MSLGSAQTISLTGLQGHHVTVEAHIASALPAFTIIGLPDTSLNEARDRVRAAISSVGIAFPARRITVNLAPASLPKSGSGFDLAVAIAILDASEHLPIPPVPTTAYFGELGLDGRVHAIRGVLPMVVAAKNAGVHKVVLPQQNVTEAQLIDGIEVLGVTHIAQVLRLHGVDVDPPLVNPSIGHLEHSAGTSSGRNVADLSEVIGQQHAKFALEVAAAGGHNIFLVGPPGTGKSMLASRLPGLLPDLSHDEALEVASIKSLSGTLGTEPTLSLTAPFESPHHTATSAALIGGGSSVIRPGAISRAHRGVLFLDEAPEFSQRVLQTLRQPMEQGTVSIARVSGTASYPAKFQLVAAANPCPCGNAYGTGTKCVCSSLQQRRYMQRLSGPLMDRIDLQVEVLPVNSGSAGVSETTATVAERVLNARRAARERLAPFGWASNSEVSGRWMREKLGSSSSVMRTINTFVDRGSLSMRGADRVLRVAWTLADLQGESAPSENELLQAAALRTRMGN